jgi:hypothetical protein
MHNKNIDDRHGNMSVTLNFHAAPVNWTLGFILKWI